MSRRKETDNEFDEIETRGARRSKDATDERTPPKQKRRRWPWLVLMLVAGVFFLPNMIGWFGLHQTAIDYALADFNGKISVGQVSLGWLQPIKLTEVGAVDANGNTLFLAETVTTSKPLYSFLTSADYGQFDVQNPVAYIQLRPDGSNLEDALANYIGPAADPNAVPDPNAEVALLPKLIVNITGGQAMVSTTTSTQTWQIDGLNAIAQVSAVDAPLVVDAQCRVTPMILDRNGQATLQNSGGLAISSQIDAGQQTLTFNSAELLLETENLPLSLAAPVLQRFVGPATTAGTMNGKILAAYDGRNQSVSMDVQQLNLRGFGIVAPELLGSDQFMIENISGHGVLQVSPTIIAAQQFKLQSDVGNIQADGSFDINQLTNLASGGQLLDTPFQMDGDVDLAKLIRMLPSTLQLHKDLVINSGTVTFQAGSRNENGTKRMVVNLDTANINARRGAHNINWAKPLRLVGTVQESKGQLALEEVRCISDFLTIIGSADMRTGSFVATGDLDKLMQRVGQFVDLEGTKLAGVLDGKFGWQVDPSGPLVNSINGSQDFPVQIIGNFDILNPIIEMAGMPRWQQQKMSVKLTAAGISKNSGSQLQLDQGGIQVDIGPETMIAKLAQPVVDAFTNSTWNTDCQMTGSMAGWLGHLKNFVDLGDVAAGGQLNLTCGAIMDSQEIQFSNIQYDVEQLTFDGYGMKIREPKAVGTGTAVYDLATGNVSIPETTLSASSVSARGQQLQITYPSNMRVDGRIAFKADVNRVADWYELSPTPESIFWYGTMDGTIQLASNENGIGGRVNSTITDLIAAKQVDVPNQRQSQPGQTIQISQPKRQWQEVWREPKVGVSGDLSLANDFNAIGFQDFLIDSPSLRAKANGSIADLAGAMLADITGTWRPSWEKINSLLQAYTGDLLKFAGNSEQQFVMRGPIYETATQPGQPSPGLPPSLQAAATFGWDQGEILGLAVGKSKMEMNLDQGIANLKTNGIPFSGGVVQMAPQIDMRGEMWLLTMQRTRMIDNVALQPETARQWLKYVAPLVADATSARGNFTVDVGTVNVPISDPMKMEVQGEVTLSNVVIGAGPTAEQLLGTVKQLRALLKPGSSDRDLNTWLQMSQQTVPVSVKDGRVFHDNVKLAHKDVVVQTRGSVGFDQTLNLVAEIPIADDWIAGKSYLASLRGKSISIPIGGTISKPVLDRRAVQQLSQDLVKQAAGGLITDKFNEERDKLLGKFGEKLGLPNGATQTPTGQPNGQPNGQPTGQPTNQQSLEDQLRGKAQDELIKGIGNLFGK